jgi:N-sulfoglucosamine sulfohydrolase
MSFYKTHRSMCLLGMAVFVLCSIIVTPAVAQKKMPNIIWISSDDHGRHDLGTYGAPIHTPNLDRLAQEGMRFDNAFATSCSCSPSRSSIFTGKYSHAVDAEDLHVHLPYTERTIGSVLRKVGYYSGNLAKWHLGPTARADFDWFSDSDSDYRKFDEERPKDQPFFLHIGYHQPHRAFRPGRFNPPHDPAKVVVPAYMPDVPEVRQELAWYYDLIAMQDKLIGEMLAWLDETGLADNTIIMYFGDQGAAFPRAKTTVYDSGLGVPFIVRWPGKVPAGTVNDGLFSLVDLVPTLMEITGAPAPSRGIQGESALPAILDPQAPGREYVYGERNWHDYDDHQRTVRSKRFRLIKNAFPEEPFGHGSDMVASLSYQAMLPLMHAGKLTVGQMKIFATPRAEYELYDIQNDPNEFHNLAADQEYQDELKTLQMELLRWMVSSRDVSPEKRMINDVNIRTGARTFRGYLHPPLPRVRNDAPIVMPDLKGLKP